MLVVAVLVGVGRRDPDRVAGRRGAAHRHGARRRSCGRSARSPSAPCRPAVAHVAVGRVAGRSSTRPAAGSSISRTNWPADQVSAEAEPAGLPFWKPIEAVVGSRPERRARRGRAPPTPARRSGRRRRTCRASPPGARPPRRPCRGRPRTGRARRRAPATGARCPCRRRPRVAVAGAVAVAVAVVAQEAVTGGGGAVDGRVDDAERAAISGSSAAITPSRAYSRKPASMTARWSRSGPPLPTL